MRKKILFISGLLGLIGLALFGMWDRAAHQLESHFKTCLVDLHDQGWEISYKEIRLQGFPFSFKMSLNHPQLKGPNLAFTEMIEVQLSASLWNWSEISVTIPEKMKMTYLAGNSSPLILTGQNFRGTWDLKKKALTQAFKIKMNKVALKTASFDGHAESFSLENFPLENPSLFRIQAVAEKVILSPDFKLPFFNRADQINLIFRFDSPQPLVFSAEHSMMKTFAHSLAFEGATIELEEATFKKDDFQCYASGTFSLDTHYQPLAALSTRIQNIQVLFDAMISSKILSSKNINMIKLFLFPLQKSSENSFSMHQVPLSLQQGKLSLGPFPLLSFPPLDLETLLK